MSEVLEPMTVISDLALILICAGLMTLIFKKLKQPLVLGYIVAGFLASPEFSFIPSVTSGAFVHVWSELGVIFLLFALGLEFSFKKILKVGGPAIIAALTIIIGMIFLGVVVGKSFGWSRMDALFLGGMIAMSSTTIIYKAFEDLGLRQKRFAGLVMSILILEDILAVVLMVLLSTMALSNTIEGGQMLRSILKLAFFLTLWFVVGLFLIPLILKKVKKLMNDETLLVVALGLCFGMVVLAEKTGFSAAFGAFIMGSILAETIEAERIDHLVKPVKDLFGAVFFVSVGMMVSPSIIVQNWLPILVITLTVIIGQSTFATLGVLLSGQPLKTAVQCGFSLTQIGEFAFIIAALRESVLGIHDSLYPIVVAVSVITIFLTPYMIRLSGPAYLYLETHLPAKWLSYLSRYNTGATPLQNDENHWKTYLLDIIRSTLINGIITFAILSLSYSFLVPLLERIPWLGGTVWMKIISAALLLLMTAPFLRSMMIRGLRSEAFMRLWTQEGKTNRAPLVATVVIRILVALGFIVSILAHFFHFSVFLVSVLALGLIALILTNRLLKRQSQRIEDTFNLNLRSREIAAEHRGEQRPAYATRLMSKDLHLADFVVPADTPWAGKSLMELSFGKEFGVHVVSILRGERRINIPSAMDRIYPQDQIQVIGTDHDLDAFGKVIASQAVPEGDVSLAPQEMILSLVKISERSPFLGVNIKNSGIRSQHHCLIAGVEKADGELHTPDPEAPLEEGDILWVVGEKKDVSGLLAR